MSAIDSPTLEDGVSSDGSDHSAEKLKLEVRSLTTKLLVISLIALVSLVVAVVALTKPADEATVPLPSVIFSSSSEDMPEGYQPRGSVFQGAGQWAWKAQMPLALSDFVAVSAMKDEIEHIFIIGGHDNMGGVSSNLTIWDPLLRKFTVGANMPAPRTRFAAAALNGKIYVMGGFDSQEAFIATTKTLVYDIETDTWAYGQDSLVAHADSCAAAIGDSLYLVGGYDTNNDYNPFQTLEILSPGADALNAQFTQGPDMPTPRGDISCANLDGHLAVIGGWSADWSSPRATFETYDPTTQTWTARPDAPNPRGDGGMATLSQGRLIVVSGEISARGVTQIPQHEVDMFVLTENTWIEVAPIITARFRHAVVAVDDVIYAMGGHEVCGYELDPTNSTISTCPETALSSIEAYLTLTHTPLYYYERV